MVGIVINRLLSKIYYNNYAKDKIKATFFWGSIIFNMPKSLWIPYSLTQSMSIFNMTFKIAYSWVEDII